MPGHGPDLSFRTLQVLEAAARLATSEGLEGLSIGRLAEAVHMTKSGLFALFGSKEELRLATIDATADLYDGEIVQPVLAEEPGKARLLLLGDRYFDFVERGGFPGVCFFVYTSLDPAAHRESVRKRLAEIQRRWLELIERLAREAAEAAELSADEDPGTLAFELDSIIVGAVANAVLLEDRSFLRAGRSSFRRRLAAG